MSKRFTDTDKWKKVWFRELKPIYKCFWEYVRDNCNNAGIWEVDFKLASFQVGAKLNQTEIESVFKKQFVKVNHSKWFLVDFIEWQYNCSIENLNPKNNAHLSAIRILEKFNIKKLIEGLERAQSAPMDKDKNKDMDKDKIKNIRISFKNPTKQQIADYCKENKFTTIDVEYFIDHYNSNGWMVGKNKMRDWKSTVSNWERRNLKDKPKKRKIIGSLYKCEICDYKKVFKEEGSYECPQPPNKCEGLPETVDFSSMNDIKTSGRITPLMSYQKVVYEGDTDERSLS